MSSATALHSHIKATSSSESHLIRVYPCIEQFIRGKNELRNCVQGVDTDSFRSKFGEKVARSIKIKLITDLVLGIAPLDSTTFATMVLFIRPDDLVRTSSFLGFSLNLFISSSV